MAELASAAFAAVSSAFAATAAAAPAISTAATVLSGIATAGSVLMGIAQSNQTRNASYAALREGEINAQAAEIEGERAATASAARAVELRRDAIRKMGSINVAFAASGLDASSGQLEGLTGEVENETAYGVKFEEINQQIARDEPKLMGMRYRDKGRSSYESSKVAAMADVVGGFSSGAKGLLSIAKRG